MQQVSAFLLKLFALNLGSRVGESYLSGGCKSYLPGLSQLYQAELLPAVKNGVLILPT
jgi:hypothetical protein